MTFEQQVEKARKGQWAMAEAAFDVSESAEYGDNALERFAAELEIGERHARKLVSAWQRRQEIGRLTAVSQSAVMELENVPDEAVEALLDENPKPTLREARKAAEPYKQRSKKTREQIEAETEARIAELANEGRDALREIKSLAPDCPITDESKHRVLRRMAEIVRLAKEISEMVAFEGQDIDAFLLEVTTDVQA